MYYWTEEDGKEALKNLLDAGITSAYIFQGFRTSDRRPYWRVFY